MANIGENPNLKKHVWDSFKDARTWFAIMLFIVFAVNLIVGHFDDIALSEYISLIAVTAAAVVYLHRKYGEATKLPVIIVFLLSALLGYLAYYRQELRFNNYEISYDVAYSNTRLADGSPGVQLGLCLLNPNPYPVYIDVGSISVSIGSRAGSYVSEVGGRVQRIGRFSSNAVQFGNPIATTDPASPNHSANALLSPEIGILRADIAYGRNQDGGSFKPLKVDAQIGLLLDYEGSVKGVGLRTISGDPPNSYGFSPKKVSWKCERLSSP